jgi:hypothetical protein
VSRPVNGNDGLVVTVGSATTGAVPVVVTVGVVTVGVVSVGVVIVTPRTVGSLPVTLVPVVVGGVLGYTGVVAARAADGARSTATQPAAHRAAIALRFDLISEPLTSTVRFATLADQRRLVFKTERLPTNHRTLRSM